MATEERREGMDPGVDLDIEQSDRFQRTEWRVERVGTVLLVLFVLAGLLGFLGPGAFSHSVAESEAGALQVEYRSITHHLAAEDLTFMVSGDAVEDDTVTLVLTGPWINGVDVSGITPQPSTQYAIPGGVAMEFDVLRPGDLEIDFSIRANDYWLLDAQASVGEDSVSFSQFVLP